MTTSAHEVGERMAGREIARPLSEWREEDGDVLWWRFPIEEAPYVGSPVALGREMLIQVEITLVGEAFSVEKRVHVGGWPGYHTHWTRIATPSLDEQR